jgi:hypothetical protein
MAILADDNIYRSVNDLARIVSQSDTPDQVVLLSERSLGILNNLAEREINDYRRYASAFGDGDTYYPVESDSTDAETVDSLINNIRLELIPVSDIRPIYSLAGALTTATSAIPNNTPTNLPITTLDAIPAELVSYASGAFTVNRSGRMALSMRAYWAGNVAGFRQCRILLDSVVVGLAINVPATTQVYAHGVTINPYVFAGQVIKFEVSQNSGAALNLNGATAPSYLTSLSIVGF